MTAVSNFFLTNIDRLGAKLVGIVTYTAQLLSMTYLSVRATLFDQAQGLRTVFSVVSAQIFFTGWQALPLITLLALAVGSIIVMQSTAQFSLIGNMDFVARLLVVIVVRELGPLVTALVVIARSGTAVASELGNMRVNREIEALESMGIHPMSFIIFPRLVGGMVSVLCLAFYFNVIAIVGGFFVTSVVQHLSFHIYLDSLAQALSGQDALLFLLKNSFSGLIIFLVSCHQGLSVEKGPHEVPQVTTKAVVNSILYVVCFNLSVTTAYYFNELVRLGVI